MGLVLPVIVAVVGVWIAFSIVVWATGRDTLLDLAPAGAPPGLGDGEPVSEASVGALRFDTGARGYRTDQVDAALYRLAWEIGRRDEQLAELRAELDGPVPVAVEEDRGEEALAEYDGDGPVEPETQAEAFDAEPFEEPLDEDTFRLAKESGADGGDAGREAGREDEGDAAPRGES
ncbi:DivIVA domain-containing protein [Glycomyces sp. NPDC047010]|uniref:DivIVA domain-containing protein n=1 Tax=Glycomyces sp. NPDC047010 TaxID=3155023 RepID=UPI0033F897F0